MPTALRAKPSPVGRAESSWDCGSEWGSAVPGKGVGVDLPLVTSCALVTSILFRLWKDTLPTAVTMEDIPHSKQLWPVKSLFPLVLVTALLAAAVPFMCQQQRLCPAPPQVKFKVLMKVVTVHSSSFLSKVWDCSQISGGSSQLAGTDGHLWSRTSWASSARSAGWGCLSLASGDSTANPAEKLFLFATF